MTNDILYSEVKALRAAVASVSDCSLQGSVGFTPGMCKLVPRKSQEAGSIPTLIAQFLMV